MKNIEKKLFEKYAYWKEKPEKIGEEKEMNIMCACCGWCG